MFRKVLLLITIGLVFYACELQAAVIHSTWIGGDEGLWGDANNWSPSIVPDNTPADTFFVTIDSNGIDADEIEVYLERERIINQLDCYGEVDFEVRSLSRIRLSFTDTNGLTNHGVLGISGYMQQVEIIGNVSNNKQAILDLGVVEIHGNLYNLEEATVYIEAWNDIQDGIVQNDGTIIIGPASDLLVDGDFLNAGTLTLHDGEFGTEAIFDNNSTGIVQGYGVFWVEQSIRNDGQIVASGGSLAVACDGSLINTGLLRNNPTSNLHINPASQIDNSGTIEVHGGGGVGIGRNVVNESGGAIKLLGGTLAAPDSITQLTSANFSGFGQVSVADRILIEDAAIVRFTGPCNIVGDVNIPSNAALEVSDGITLITGHTTCDNGTIHMIGGRVICQGGLTNNNCNIVWEPGLYTNMADFNLDGRVNFDDFAYFADVWLWQAKL